MADNFNLKKYLKENTLGTPQQQRDYPLGTPEQQDRWAQKHRDLTDKLNGEMDQRVFDFLQGYAKENDISNKDAVR